MAASESLNLIFVYGTLKKGERNYPLISTLEPGDHSKFIAECVLMEKYPLVVKATIPYLLHRPGVGKHVEGELYEVNGAILGKLDKLERHPDYYTRTKTVVVNKTDGSQIDCEVYFIFKDIEELIALPHYKCFAEQNEPKHST